MADDAYAKLAELIEEGGLEPGSLWTEAGLVEHLGVGRTPLREAVQRLDRDRLVRVRTGRGIEIPPLSVEDQLRRLEVRRSLECLAAALACQRASASEIAAIAEFADALVSLVTLERYARAVRESHRLLRLAAHNDYLADAMTPLHGLSRRFWLAHLADVDAEVASGKRLYLGILRPLCDRDAEEAQRGVLRLNDFLVESAMAVMARHARTGWTDPVAY